MSGVDNTGPPDRERPGPRISVRVNPKVGSSPKSPTDAKAIPRLCRRNTFGRHAGDVWREGYGYGFRAALRLAAREIDDPAVWVVLDRLADDYDLAGER